MAQNISSSVLYSLLVFTIVFELDARFIKVQVKLAQYVLLYHHVSNNVLYEVFRQRHHQQLCTMALLLLLLLHKATDYTKSKMAFLKDFVNKLYRFKKQFYVILFSSWASAQFNFSFGSYGIARNNAIHHHICSLREESECLESSLYPHYHQLKIFDILTGDLTTRYHKFTI